MSDEDLDLQPEDSVPVGYWDQLREAFAADLADAYAAGHAAGWADGAVEGAASVTVPIYCYDCKWCSRDSDEWWCAYHGEDGCALREAGGPR